MSTVAAPSPEILRETVRRKYARVAQGREGCCGTGELSMIGDAYDGVEGHVPEADLGLGCGLPVQHAGLVEGMTVLDLGSGAGVDAFVARRQVGATGKVIGLDFTPEMVALARKNAERLGYENVEFVEGAIEDMPLPDASVDVAISNCVLNLVPDKAQAFAEMHRVLRPGGHFCVSDIVSEGSLPAHLQHAAELYAGCVSGAMDRRAYIDLLEAAGFENVRVVAHRPIPIPNSMLADLDEAGREALRSSGIVSVTVVGTKS